MRPFSPRAIMPHFNQLLLDSCSRSIDGAVMLIKSAWFGSALFASVVGCSMLFTTAKAEAQMTNCMDLGGGMISCNTVGGGTGGPVASPVDVYRSIFGDKTRKAISRLLANGDCEGAARYAYDKGRLELGMKIAATCQQRDVRTGSRTYAPDAGAPKFRQSTGSLYQTVDYLARNVSVPFTVDAAAGTFSVTKVEAMDTQLSMNVLVSDPKLKIADVASPANLQVVCDDSALNEVLQLGGSIRLNFFRNNGAFIGAATQTAQSCRP